MTSITVNQAQVADLNHLWSRHDPRSVGAGSLVRQLRFLCNSLCWQIVRGGGKVIKRSVDVVAAASMLTLLTPFFLVTAALIKLTDGGPVFFWQERVGKWGRTFEMPKFRSMIVNAEAARAELLDRSTILSVSTCSASARRGTYRCVVRGCFSTRHARRSETPSLR